MRGNKGFEMNETFRELAEQAGYTKDMFGVGHWDMPECKKFAELIVQECLAQVDKVETMLEDEPEQATGASWVGFAIAKHFGVE